MIPTIGRIVIYTLNADDVVNINRARATASMHAGSQGGNSVKVGDEFPMMITKVWDAATGCVSGQVSLDGPDFIWVTSRLPVATATPGSWHWPLPAPLSMPAAFTAPNENVRV